MEEPKKSQEMRVELHRPLIKELRIPITVDRTVLDHRLHHNDVSSEPPSIDITQNKQKGFRLQEPHKVTDGSTTDSSLSNSHPVRSQPQVTPLCSLEDLYQDLNETDKRDFDSLWNVRKAQLQQSAEQRALVTFRQNMKERKKLEQVIDESLKQYCELYEMAQVVKLHIEAEKAEWLARASQQYLEPYQDQQLPPQSFSLLEEQLCAECHRRKRSRGLWEREEQDQREGQRQRVDIVPFHNGLEDFQYDMAEKKDVAVVDDDSTVVKVTRPVVNRVRARKFITPYKGSAVDTAVNTTTAAAANVKAAVVEM